MFHDPIHDGPLRECNFGIVLFLYILKIVLLNFFVFVIYSIYCHGFWLTKQRDILFLDWNKLPRASLLQKWYFQTDQQFYFLEKKRKASRWSIFRPSTSVWKFLSLESLGHSMSMFLERLLFGNIRNRDDYNQSLKNI